MLQFKHVENGPLGWWGIRYGSDYAVQFRTILREKCFPVPSRLNSGPPTSPGLYLMRHSMGGLELMPVPETELQNFSDRLAHLEVES